MDINSRIDPRQVVSGKDAQIFVTTSDGTQIFLAEAENFVAQMNINNQSFQGLGSMLEQAVPLNYSVTVTLTEIVIRDDVMLGKLFEDLSNGYFPAFDFQGKIARRDGQEQRQIFRDCMPDGTIDLMNLTPGDIVKRPWSFRANATPELQKMFKAA